MTDLLQVAAEFALKGEAFSYSDYGSGHIHDTFLLESGDRRNPTRYVLQRLNTTVFAKPEAVQDNISRILEHLKKDPGSDHGFRDPEIIATHDGRTLYVDRGGNYWRCYAYIEDAITLERVENPEQAREAALSFGMFTARLKDYDPRRLHITIPNFMDVEWRQKQLAYTEFTQPGSRLKESQPELKKIRRLSDIPARFIKIRQALPDRVAHNDTKISNILFDVKSGKGISVIDLDTVMTGTLLTDFGDMVRSFTPSGDEDQSRPEAFNCREDVFEGIVTGYAEAVSPLITEVEKMNLLLGAKVVIYMQAMRFLTDYLKGDTYYKTSYADQNLHRTRNQLGLLESLLKKEELLQGILKRSF